MTLEEEDAVIGRLTRERAELSRRLTALGEEISSIGVHLQELGKILQRTFQLHTAEITSEQKTALDINRITALINEWKDVSNSLHDRTEKLDKLGLG